MYTTSVLRRRSRSVRSSALLTATLLLACSGGGSGGPTTDDRARVDVCVLAGATTVAGCSTAGDGSPLVDLGDVAQGESKSREIAVYNGGAGNVSATVSMVTLVSTGSTANYELSLFTKDGAGAETPAGLPFSLGPDHGAELRARVTFRAFEEPGAVSGVTLRIAASHPAVSRDAPIVANVTGCPPGLGDCDGDPSNACETDLEADVTHCGACASACDETNGTASCVGGLCGITCDAGFENCDGGLANGCEANLLDDPLHCGTCATACDATNGAATCLGGLCGITCDAGFGNCDASAANGCEVDLRSDTSHCGTCATACGTANGTASCSGGTCAIACDAGRGDCDGTNANGCETDLRTDVSHCGACAGACSAVNATPSCSAGSCSVACDAGFGDCDADVSTGCEVSLRTDVLHCGACASPCSTANAAPSCSGGACALSCAAGFADCDANVANGCEIDTRSDVLHCGACATACSTANGTPSCSAGACGIACSPGFADCDASASTGCEIDTRSDVLHCGACGTRCSTVNATPSCSGGACALSCAAGFADCDGSVANGCEVDTRSDVAHCGACGTACSTANASPSCSGGACALSCAAGFGDCDGSVATGCETSTSSDLAHCGACGNACSVANGTPACSGGACAIASCHEGFADCDGNPANGCEVNLAADSSHCGACGTACAAPNGTPACFAGVCGIAACDGGFDDCDGGVANGCEVNLGTDAAHCGTCAVTCDGTNGLPVCTGGLCGITCDTGFDDCDGSVANGCEVNLGTDPAHCGTCAVACNGTNGAPVCSGGLCGVTCDPGYADCDASAGNGCEIDLRSDLLHCGACATSCGTAGGTASCTGGACAIACEAGRLDCDGVNANGCEADLQRDVLHCGACGTACTAANGTPACAGGTCGIASCDAGYGNCDGAAGTGCETSLASSVAHCGSCGNACSVPNGTPACSGGACAIAACDAGFADCDGNPANGCEVNVAADASNCGTCGNGCSVANGTAACAGGTCGIAACNPGFADCDGNPANGCEANLASDWSSCGTCGHTCAVANGTAACTGGSCTVTSCAPGFDNCDGAAANGCEANLVADPAHCGSCTTACNAPCAGGSCTTFCFAPFQNCDGNPSNGCEANLYSSVSTCGACGNNCLAKPNVVSATCGGGTCYVTGCGAGWVDVDGQASNGCECVASTASATCGGATGLGSYPVGSSGNYRSAVAPANQDAWFQLDFPSDGTPNYSPWITLMVDGGAPILMDVYSDCSGNAPGCMDGSSIGKTTWESYAAGGVYGSWAYNPVPAVGTRFVRVYRTATSASCGTFTLYYGN